MGRRRSRSGEYVVLGCLFAPGAALLALGLLPSPGRHGNGLFAVLGLGALAIALLIVLLQAVLPKPPEPPERPPVSNRVDG